MYKHKASALCKVLPSAKLVPAFEPACVLRSRSDRFRLPSPPRRTFCASILSMPRAQKHNLADCFYGKPARPVCRRAVRDLHAPQPCRRSSAALGRVPPHAARRKCRAVCRPSRIRLICFALRHTPIARFRQTANFPHCGALPAGPHGRSGLLHSKP